MSHLHDALRRANLASQFDANHVTDTRQLETQHVARPNLVRDFDPGSSRALLCPCCAAPCDATPSRLARAWSRMRGTGDHYCRKCRRWFRTPGSRRVLVTSPEELPVVSGFLSGDDPLSFRELIREMERDEAQQQADE